MKLKQFALRGLIVLMVAVALCMFFARTVQTITTPKVRLYSPGQGRLEQEITLTAQVHFPDTEEIVIEAAKESPVTVEKVYVQPGSYVKAYDKARDRAVRRVLAGALKLRAQMEDFMADAVKTMDGLAAMKESLGTRGNFSARSFDALIEVTIKQQYNVRLDGRVQKARELMLEYATRELERAGKGAFLLQQMIDLAQISSYEEKK